MLYRPLLLSSVSPDLAAARGVPLRVVGIGYLFALAIAVSLSAVTIGAILSTALLVGPAATALRLTKRTGLAMVLAATVGVAATWIGILLAYDSYDWPPTHQGWPVSFFVVTLVLRVLPRRPTPLPATTPHPARPARIPHSLMFAGFMIHAWEAATIVAVVAGVVGFFTVMRGSAFAAHALPNGAFAGAAGASLIGVNTIVGLGVFSLLGALTIGAFGRRARQDVATALVIVMMLGLGALFLSMTTEYAPQIYSLLFGEVLGVANNELLPTAAIGAGCIAAILILYRPLLLSSVITDVAEARGITPRRMELAFLVVVALTTTMAVPVVGSLLIFSLLIGPAAAARSLANTPHGAMALRSSSRSRPSGPRSPCPMRPTCPSDSSSERSAPRPTPSRRRGTAGDTHTTPQH